MFTKSYFYNFVNRNPEMDDLERCSCQKQGQIDHMCCGWNFDKQLPVYMAGIPSEQRIQCVAHQYRNDDSLRIIWAPRPFRHHDIFYQYGTIIKQLKSEGYIETQGFLTNSGLFVNREDGLLIAKKANQIINKTQPDYKLFSEDMW